uniref:Uncharacterized protein n=1 Tax=Pseudoalteromonas luteoviolacea TaxID=43657 RepID=A0A023PZE0_9GAMM|nr:hypothetical protein [Pseudoalteromonas luteoviolacea]
MCGLHSATNGTVPRLIAQDPKTALKSLSYQTCAGEKKAGYPASVASL